tara:strand:- start:2555 stop:3610 length:1056 start_codon:yes stop_codon:yes gene_type:complete
MELSNIDNHKLMYHSDEVSEWKGTGDHFPIYVEVGLTNACNHRCIFCALDFVDFGKDFIDKKVMLTNLEDMATNGLKSIMFAGEGESLLHKDIGLFTKQGKKYGLDMAITTNGVPLNEKKREECLPYLSWIRFSIDSGSPKNYAKIHGTNPRDFDKVINNIKRCVEFKYKNNLQTTIGAQFLMVPQNMKQGKKLAKILKNIGVDNLQIKPYSHHPFSNNDFVVSAKKYNKLEKKLKKYNSKDFKILFRKATAERISCERDYDQCYGLPFYALIDAKANVIPCNMFYNNPEFTYGNLYKNKFSEIWKSDTRKEIIKKINKKGIEKCRQGCRLDVVNIFLKRTLNPEPHDNFI